MAIIVDDMTVHITTRNEYDYDIINSPSHTSLTLGSLRDALIERVRAVGKFAADQPSYAYDGRALHGSVTIRDLVKNPWSDDNVIYMDLTEGDTLESTFTFTSIKPLRIDDIESGTAAEFGRHDAKLLSILPMNDDFIDEASEPSRNWAASAYVPVSTSFSKLSELHSDLMHAFMFTRTGPTSPRQVRELLRMSGASRLLGMRENDWLEVKRAAYEAKVDKDRWKLDLALDVASFANSDQGGVIVIGIATQAMGGSDVLYQIHPVPAEPGRARRYHDVLNARVAPFVDGLAIETHEHEGGELVSIFIPPQREELKPFVVDGGVSRSGHAGRLFSVVRRRGEGTTIASVHEIQATLAAGRAFLRGHQDTSQ